MGSELLQPTEDLPGGRGATDYICLLHVGIPKESKKVNIAEIPDNTRESGKDYYRCLPRNIVAGL